MGDRIDDLMAKQWSRLQGLVNSGLKVEPEIKSFVSSSVREDADPYRVLTPAYAGTVDPPPADPGIPGVQVRLDRFDPRAVDGAFELTVYRELALSQLEGDLDASMKAFGHAARMIERRVILGQLAPEGDVTKLDVANLKTSTQRFGRPCTLIWASDGKGSKDSFEKVVDDFVDPQGCLPDELVAILVPQVGGPTLLRLVDDLTLSWERATDAGSVRLSLSERFFLDQPERAQKFKA